MSWKKLSSRVIWENDWMQVREDEVVNPGGGNNLYGHVRFKNRAVAIVALDDDGNTWLVGQERYTLGCWSWELPMGGAPLEEDLLLAAQRELKEETGLSAEHWTEIMRLHTYSLFSFNPLSHISEDNEEPLHPVVLFKFTYTSLSHNSIAIFMFQCQIYQALSRHSHSRVIK